MKRLCASLAPGQRVWVSTLNAEPKLLRDELLADPDRAAGVTFMGVQFPGIDTIDYLSLHPAARLWGCFMSPALRAGWREGRAELLPLDYQALARQLEEMPPVDLAIAQLTPPDADGWCSPGVASDFLPLVWHRAHRRVAQLNPRMPRMHGSFRVHLSELDGFVEAETTIGEFRDGNAGDVEARIAAHVAALVPDGATLQFGIGAVPLAMAGALVGHRHLKLHTGMVTSTLRTLWDTGALDRDAQITTGVVLGDASLQAFCGDLPNLWLTDVRHTHDPARIGQIPDFVSVNAAVEVDLLGQVNSERGPAGIQAGAGGLPAFAAGALGSARGRLIICLPANARGGSVSRIVPVLGNQSLCTLPRHQADTIVTEHGVAQLRGLAMDQRAQALIAIAAPEQRAALSDAWDALRRSL